MPRRKMPARYKSGPKKGQFKPSGRRTTRLRASRNPGHAKPNGTRRGMRRKTARRAYMPVRRRRTRRNQPTNKELNQVIIYSAIAAFAQPYVSKFLSGATGSPMAASYGTISVLGIAGFMLSKKAKTKAAGYGLLGVTFAKLASEILKATGLGESGSAFLPKRDVIMRLPKRVNIPSMNPVGRIVVPG